MRGFSMAILLRSNKYRRNFLEISKSFVFHTSQSYCRRDVSSQINPFKSLKCVHFDSKSLSIKKSLTVIDEKVKKYRQLTRSDVDQLIKSITEHETIDSHQALAALKCFGNILSDERPQVRIDLVKNLWNIIESRGIPVNVEHYNALITVYIENEFDFNPEDLLKELELKQLQPNRYTYQLLIKKYSVTGDIENISKVLQKMDEANMKLNIHIYNSLILAYGYDGDFETAKHILKGIKSSGMKLTAVTYRNIVLPFARSGAIDDVILFLNRFRSNRIPFTDLDVLRIIYELSTNGHGYCVDRILPFLQYTTGYRSEAQRYMLKLLIEHQDYVAFTVLKTMTRNVSRDGSQFYLQQLIKLNRPMQRIFDVCDKLKKHGISQNPINSLLHAATSLGSNDLALEIMRELKKKNVAVNTAHFHAIFKGTSSAEETLRILDIMQKEFELKPDFYFLREFVIDALGSATPEEQINYLQKADLSKSTAVVAVTLNVLRECKLKEATDLIEHHKVGIHTGMFAKDLLIALTTSNDAENFARFLRISFENSRALNKLNNSLSRADELGDFLIRTIRSLSSPDVIESVIQHLVKENIRIPASYVNKMEKIVDPKLVSHLNQLIATESDDLSTEMQFCSLRNDLFSYYEANNLIDYSKCLEQLEAEMVILPEIVYVHLIILQAENNDIPTALKTFENVREKFPNLKLTKGRTIARCAAYLYTNKGLTEAIEFLAMNSPTEINTKFNDDNLMTYGRLLYTVSETGNIDDLNLLYNILRKCNYFKLGKPISNSNVLGPFVKVHLAKGDTDKACTAFSEIASQHKCLPLLHELMTHLILNNDQDNIIPVTDIVAKFTGMHGSQFLLAMACIQSGKLERAFDIFSTKIAYIRPNVLEPTCKFLVDNDRLDVIETFLKLTQQMDYYDKTIVWNILLDVYWNDATTERVITLMERIRDAHDSVDNSFACKLQEFFRQKGEQMPFSLKTLKRKRTRSAIKSSSFFVFSKFIYNKEILVRGIQNMEQLKSYLENLLKDGNVKKFEAMKRDIRGNILYESRFSTFAVEAYIRAGRIEEFIDRTIESLKAADSLEQIREMGREIPSATYLDILNVNPNAIHKLQKLAVELAKRTRFGPINIIWCYYVLENNDAASRKIWNDYLVKVDKIQTGALVHAIKAADDEKLATTLLTFLKSHPNIQVRKIPLGLAYDLLLRKLTMAKKYDEGLQAVDEAIQNDCYKFITIMTLERFQDALNKVGKEFPHVIPSERLNFNEALE